MERRSPRGITRRLSRVVAAMLVTAATSVVGSGRAEAADPASVGAAKAAYDRGTAAFDRSDYAEAAKEYARADELAPTSAALEAALRSAIRADDPALGMRLVERSRRAPASSTLAELVKLAEARFRERVGQIVVTCPEGCQATIDGEPAPGGAKRWMSTGEHRLELTTKGQTERRTVVVTPGGFVEVRPLAAVDVAPAVAPGPISSGAGRPAASPSDGQEGKGLSPGWFWALGGISAVAGGATIASGIDAVAKHDAFQQDQSSDNESAGRAAETRTNILIAVTAVAAVTTVVIGMFAVRWSSADTKARASPSLLSPRRVAVGGYTLGR